MAWAPIRRDIFRRRCYIFRMRAPAAERFTCDWIFKILVVLSDGKVVCGCADPYGERPLGTLARTSIGEIWNSEKVQEIRNGLNQGYAPFCLPCGLKRSVSADGAVEHRPVVLQKLPRIFLEPTVLCNLSCDRAVCSRESGIVSTRIAPLVPLRGIQGPRRRDRPRSRPSRSIQLRRSFRPSPGSGDDRVRQAEVSLGLSLYQH